MNDYQLVQEMKRTLGPELTDIEICGWLSSRNVPANRWVECAHLFNWDPYNGRIGRAMSELQSRGHDFDIHLDNWLAGCYPTVTDLVENMSISDIKLLMMELAKN